MTLSDDLAATGWRVALWTMTNDEGERITFVGNKHTLTTVVGTEINLTETQVRVILGLPGDFDPDEDFYQEDEDPDKIHAVFDAGEKGVTLGKCNLECVFSLTQIDCRLRR